MPDLPAKIGRPSTYDAALAESICELIEAGSPLRAILRDEGMPPIGTFFSWVDTQPGLSERYAHARLKQYQVLADELVEISDDGSNDTYEDEDGKVWTNHDVINRSRLRVDTRKWILSKMLPKIYGEKSVHEVSGPNGGEIPLPKANRPTAEEIAAALLILAPKPPAP